MQSQLDKERFSFIFAETGQNGIHLFCEQKPDIVLVNLMLPDTDGIMLCRELREQPNKNFPFIFIFSDQAASYCEVEAFRSGADDYIHIPFNAEALKWRLEAFINRSVQTANLLGNPYLIIHADIRIDTKSCLVFVNDKVLIFQKKEVELLTFLAKTPDKVFTREEILKEVWNEDINHSTIRVDLRIHSIRQKIGEGRIKTIKNVGYKFVAEP